MVLLQQMLIFFLIMLVGMLARKKGIFRQDTGKLLSGIVVNIANPALAVSAVTGSGHSISKSELGTVFAIAGLYYVFLLACTLVIPRVLRAKGKDEGAYQVMTVFSNVGFMGYPLVSSIYGVEAVLYAIPFNLIYTVLIYTYGIQTLSKGKDNGNRKLSIKESFRMMCNIGVFSSILAILIFLFEIPVPVPIASALEHLGSLTAPLSMLVIGDSMCDMNLKQLIRNKAMLVFSLIKTLVIPILGLTLLSLIPESICPLVHDPMFFGVCLVMLATPVGSMTAMFAQQYDSNAKLVAEGVAFTTILSVATIPVVSFVMDFILKFI